MIKTHKPRGHLWTHASDFQQTKEFRNIDFDECEVIETSKASLIGTSGGLTLYDRVAKRQRIEKLANDFLNGTYLFISSARLPPSSSKACVIRNKKDYGRPPYALKDAIRSVEAAKPSDLSDVADADNGTATSPTGGPRNQPSSSNIKTRSRAKQSSGPTSGQFVSQQAKCRPVRRSGVVNVTTGPSVEALQQAASLRARQVKSVNQELSAIPVHVLNTSSGPRSRSSSRQRNSSAVVDPVQRLARRDSRLSFSRYVPSDDSQDELRLSNYDTPRRFPVARRKSNTNAMLANEVDNNAALEPNLKENSHGSSAFQSTTDDTVRHLCTLEDTPAPSASSSPPSRRTRSQTAKTVTKTASQRKSGYTTAPSSQNGSTPFMFRKRRSAPPASFSLGSEITTAVHKQIPRRLSHPLRQSYTLDDLTPGTDGESDSKSCHTAKADTSSSGNPDSAAMSQGEAPAHPGEECWRANVSSVMEGNLPNSPTVETALCQPTRKGSTPRSHNDAESEAPFKSASAASQFWAGTQFLLDKAQHDLLASPEKQDPFGDQSLRQRHSQNNETPKNQPLSSRHQPLQRRSQEVLPSTQQLLGDFEGWSTVKKPWAGPRPSLLPTPTAKGKTAALGNDLTILNDLSFSPLHTRPSKETRRSSASNLRFSISSTAPPAALLSPAREASNHVVRGLNGTHTLANSPMINHDQSMILSHEETSPASIEDESANMLDLTLTNQFPVTSTSYEMAQKPLSLSREPSDLSQTIDDLRGMLDLSDMHGVLS